MVDNRGEGSHSNSFMGGMGLGPSSLVAWEELYQSLSQLRVNLHLIVLAQRMATVGAVVDTCLEGAN